MSEIFNPNTKRYVKIGSPAHKRLVRAGVLPAPIPETPPEPNPEALGIPIEFNEKHLQTKLAEISTDLIRDNLKTIVKSQKLSDKDLDILLKKMLYEKLCLGKNTDKTKPKETKEKKKKKKFKIVEPSSESESESD